MSFGLFLLYLTLVFIRPGEQIPELRGLPVMDVVSVLALVAVGVAVLGGRGPSFRSPQLLLMLSLGAWALVSVALSPIRSWPAFEAAVGFGKSSGVAFLLVALAVVTNRRLSGVAVLLVAVAVFVSGQAGVAEQLYAGASPLADAATAPGNPTWDGVGASGASLPSPGAGSGRLRGVGVFHDPNDLAVTLIAVLPLCLALRRDHSWVRNLLVVWIPGALILYGIYLTRSRGAVVALACVFALSIRHRIGRPLALLAGVASLSVFVTLGFIGGRTMEMDQSASNRIVAWSEGLQMLKSSPVWGVGFGMFTAYHPKTAHNTFVQCFAELGLVGYALWLSLILVTLDDLRAASKSDLHRWSRAVSSSILGFLAGGLFLSRAYDPTLYVLIGLGAAIGDLARRDGYPVGPRMLGTWVPFVGAAAAASIVAFWLYMRFIR
jgi:hypothetical protein